MIWIQPEVCYTSGSNVTAQMTTFTAHTHCYALRRVTANQHVRTEHRECSCGDRKRVVTRWADRTVEWEAA